MTMASTTSVPVSRRRFLTISAAMAGMAALPGRLAARSYRTFTWRGAALGATATLSLQHHDEAQAKAAIAECLSEVARLEAIFSLHRPDSALVRLNAKGRLDDAPLDLRILLNEALTLAERTQGAFDPTVQPLWALYASHFRAGTTAADEPAARDIEAVLHRVGWQKIACDGGSIRLLVPGMSLTLNGIAQGYITDKAGEVLRARGFTHVLVNMGEQLALGPKWDGTSWRAGIADPAAPETAIAEVELVAGALATSGGYGTCFDGAGRFSHILDPRTGRPARSWGSISILSDRATLADGLSTALMILPAHEARSLLGHASRAYAIPANGVAGSWL